MKSYEKYYTESLYPFQDGVLRLVNALRTPFYLTGGTALSRHYYNHRYSDDLDFFMNQGEGFASWMQSVFDQLATESRRGDFFIDYQKAVRTRDFAQVVLFKDDIVLKLDFVNDVAPHYGDMEESPVLGRVDGWRNILSNKLTAMGRLEIKDLVDLWVIAIHQKFNWRAVFAEAKTKDAGLDPVMIYELIRSVPAELLDVVKWVSRVEANKFLRDIEILADDLFYGHDNSLCGER